MLKGLIVSFIFLFNSVEAKEKGIFLEEVLSSKVKAECEYYKGDETGIFSIEYNTENERHVFLIMRGIDPITCKWREKEARWILRNNKFVWIDGRGGENFQLENGRKSTTWFWISLKAKNMCHSHFTQDCP